MCSCSIGLAALLVVEEHHVANTDVEEVLRLSLPATANDQIGRLLQREPKATHRVVDPTSEHVKDPKVKFCSKPFKFQWVVELESILSQRTCLTDYLS